MGPDACVQDHCPSAMLLGPPINTCPYPPPYPPPTTLPSSSFPSVAAIGRGGFHFGSRPNPCLAALGLSNLPGGFSKGGGIQPPPKMLPATGPSTCEVPSHPPALQLGSGQADPPACDCLPAFRHLRFASIILEASTTLALNGVVVFFLRKGLHRFVGFLAGVGLQGFGGFVWRKGLHRFVDSFCWGGLAKSW